MKKLNFAAAFLMLITTAFGQVPGTLSYQGILVTSTGAPTADGTHQVSFNFYTAATGGVPVIARGPLSVTTYKGMFTVLIGTGSPASLNDPLPASLGSSQYYVELVADAVILSPRVQLSTVPYAFTAQSANTMDAGGLTGTANLPNTVLNTNLQDLADGSLTGSLVGSGISASNITTGTLSGSLVGTGVNASNITTGTLGGALVGNGINATNITTGNLSLASGKFVVSGTTGNFTT